jgi:tubby-related protein 1
MQVFVPTVDENDNTYLWRPTCKEDEMFTQAKARNMKNLVHLINKPPRWNDQVGAYVLNFNGRVTMASVKNFQLVDPDDQNVVLLQVSTLVYS